MKKPKMTTPPYTTPKVIGVLALDKYQACLGCKARVESVEPTLGQYTKCRMFQRIENCNDHTSAVHRASVTPRG